MIETKRRLRVLIVCIVASSLVNLGGTLVFVVGSYQARQDNCEAVRDAFDDYTDALAAVSQAPEATVREFKDAYQAHLQECH